VVCGNIGNPLCGEISRIGKQSIVVAEVSSFQLQYIRDFRPFIGILLNVSEDHYERHGGFLPYKEAKFNIFKNQTEKDRALLFSDLKADPLRDGIKSRIDFFGEAGTAGSVYPGKIIVNMGDGKPLLIETENICLEGTHNMFNASASICASKILGVPDRIIRQVISSYKASAHRFQKLGVYNDVLYIDDSKATNIDATRVALQSVKGDVLLIAGGKDKGGDYSVMRKLIKDKVKTLILLGEAAGRIRGAFSGYTRIIDADSLKEAVIAAADMATRGDTVMLSPMCSSFDMFSSYKHRGEAYQAAVKEAIARVKVSD
jgi:UDP-N-acetylmuramoylalanine--D-glutamate ligase